MKNKHRFLTVFVVIVLCLGLMLSLIACDNDSGETGEVTDSSEYITNGNFELTTTDTFPKSPSSWTGSAGSTATNNETSTDKKDLVSGVIDTDDAVYNRNKKTWDKVENPYKTGEDSNILMIYNKTSNSYKYTSASFSLDANKYFKITVDVLTKNIDGAGAYVIINGDAYKEFHVGDTKGLWTTVTIYLETSNISSNTVSITLSNGKDGKNDGKMSEGYAFFDNIIVSELESTDALSAKNQYNNVQVSDTVAKYSMILPDSSFTNIGGKSNPYTPNRWTGVTSSGVDGSAPTGSDYLSKGIVDLDGIRPTDLTADISSIGIDAYMLFLNNKQNTAYSYRSDKKIRFSTNGYYKISIMVNTFLAEGTPITNGAFVSLKSSTDKEEFVAQTKAINTNGSWQEISFYIKADSRNKDLYMQLSLGQGGKNDLTLVKGQAFFDEIKLVELSEAEYNNATLAEYDVKHSLETALGENAFANGDFADINNNFFKQGYFAENSGSLSTGSYTIVNTDPANWDSAILGANPLSPLSTINNVLRINNSIPTITKIELDNAKVITPNKYYRIGVWVKTSDVKDSSGLNVTLYQYKDDEKKDENKRTKLASFDNINTNNIKNESTSAYNDYVELVFYVEGDYIKDQNIQIELSLGSGNQLTPATFAKGSAYATGFTMYEVKYSEYNSESGTYIKKHSFKSSSSGISNSDFNNINIADTLKQYPDIDETSTDLSKRLFDENGELQHIALPKDWTSSDKALLSSLNAGVLNLANGNLLNMVDYNNTISNPYSGFEVEFGDKMNVESNRNVLVIGTKDANEDDYTITEPTKPEVCGCTCQTCNDKGRCDGLTCDTDCGCGHKTYDGTIKNSWGFTSSSFSLSKNSYYMVSVWAYVVEGTASITLKTSNMTEVFNITEAATGWKKYTFFVETGFDDAKVTFELKLGTADATNNVKGLVMFDMPKMTTIDKDAYDLIKDEESTVSKITYTTTTFDNVTTKEDTLDSPNGWTGSQLDSDSPAGTDNVVAGVYNRDHSSRNWFGSDDNNEANRISESFLIETVLNGISADNDNVLVINNKVATEYSYVTTISSSLPTKSYYKISLKVLTTMIDDGKTATITLKLNNVTYTFSKNDEKDINVNTNGEWREYSFYIQTPETVNVDSVSLTVALGAKGSENYVSGYVFVDEVSVQKIDEDIFKAGVPVEGEGDSETPAFDQSVKHRIVFTDADAEKEPEDEEPPKTDASYLWAYILSGIIGALIIIAVAVVLFKKFYKPKKKNVASKATYSNENIEKNKTQTTTTNKNKKFKD